MLDRRQFLAALTVAALPTGAGARIIGTRPPQRPAPDPRDVVAASGLPGRIAFAMLDGRAQLLGKAALAMAPASTMKVITALYALDSLGPEYRFQTRLIRSGDMLILAGGGDPVLSTDDLASLAAALAGSGQQPPARFAVWGGALPAIAQVAPEQALHLAYNPTISGMILNFNRVHLGWRRVGVDHQLSLEARAAAQSPRVYTISAMPATHADLFTYRHDTAREYWTISRAAMGRSGSRWLPVRLPELYAGDVFQTLCRARGFVLPPPEVVDDLPVGEVVARHDSPALQTLVRDMLLYSTNITAEALGLHASGAGSLTESAERMHRWLGAVGQGMRLADHSGLSEESRLSAFGLASVLDGPGRDLRLASLLKPAPLAEDLGPDPAGHTVRAKTGTLNFVSNLAGYVSTSAGNEAAFAILCTDGARRAATVGDERPAGVGTWTLSAKALQQDLLGAFAANLDR